MVAFPKGKCGTFGAEVYSLFGGFLSHRGTPKNHPFLGEILPYKPSILWSISEGWSGSQLHWTGGLDGPPPLSLTLVWSNLGIGRDFQTFTGSKSGKSCDKSQVMLLWSIICWALFWLQCTLGPLRINIRSVDQPSHPSGSWRNNCSLRPFRWSWETQRSVWWTGWKLVDWLMPGWDFKIGNQTKKEHPNHRSISL